jgi:hypothetical protein
MLGLGCSIESSPASIDTDRGRDAAWDALAAHRDAEIESGAAIAVSGPEVVARLRAELE